MDCYCGLSERSSQRVQKSECRDWREERNGSVSKIEVSELRQIDIMLVPFRVFLGSDC